MATRNTIFYDLFSWRKLRFAAYAVALLMTVDFFPQKIDYPPPLSKMHVSEGTLRLGAPMRHFGSSIYIPETDDSLACVLRMSHGPAGGCYKYPSYRPNQRVLVYWYEYKRLPWSSGKIIAQVALTDGKIIYPITKHIADIEKENSLRFSYWIKVLISLLPAYLATIAEVDHLKKKKQENC